MEMVEVKTADLIGQSLDWAVAYGLNGSGEFLDAFGVRMLGRSITNEVLSGHIRPSTDWAQCGCLIEKHVYDIKNRGPSGVSIESTWLVLAGNGRGSIYGNGPTLLVAACRAIVAANLGETVIVPAELLQKD